MTQHQEQLKLVGDALSIGTVIATLAAWLPPLAALFTIVWTLMRIVNEWPKFSKTVNNLVTRFLKRSKP